MYTDENLRDVTQTEDYLTQKSRLIDTNSHSS